MSKEIFVFGSNLRGRHGAGAAKVALDSYGAQEGCGVGKFGDSYAIPTKDRYLRTLSLEEIKPYVIQFLNYASNHPELIFNVTRIGCGLAGYKNEDISPMFKNCPDNVILPKAWGGKGFAW
jgi:hypothetical protein